MDVLRSNAVCHTFRLSPKSDLRKSIQEFSKSHKIKAGSIITCVGSLEQLHVRFANREKGELRKGFFEIVSLTGTFADSSCHLHIAVADTDGQTMGGHLLDNNIIYTTAEIVVAELVDIEFARAIDNTYGYNELVIKHRD
ncbi:MAG: DNA-binding protein [Bacteroidetes bacterium]|nr:DNA-binding protein [Bacteroidota bacterium]MBI3482280.1 DNA-binding protein [Bacteroidota bacterium]